MAFREVLVTEVKEVLRAWLAGLGKRPAAARAGVNPRPRPGISGPRRRPRFSGDSGEGPRTDELIGVVVGAVRPARPAGHGSSWEALAARGDEISGWVRQGLTLVKIGELQERSGTAVPYRTLARFAARECGCPRPGWPGVTVRFYDPPPGRELQVDSRLSRHDP